MLSVRGEFGYWVFEGDWQPAQRPSWNYRKAEGGGIILDMLCHWRYVLDNLFGEVQGGLAASAPRTSPSAGTRAASPTTADADDAAYATFELEGGVIAQINSSWGARVRRDDLVTFQVDGTHGSAVAGLQRCCTPAPRQHAAAGVEPGRAADRSNFFDQWQEVPDNQDLRQRLQDPVGDVHPPRRRGRAVASSTCSKGAKGVQLAELGAAELGRAALDRRAGLTLGAPERWPTHRAADRRPRASSPTRRGEPLAFRRQRRPASFNRIAFAAAHVVADPLADIDPWLDAGDRLGAHHRLPPPSLGPRASASPRRWTPRSAAWASTGRRRSELIRRCARRGEATCRRADRLRRRHRPPRAGAGRRRSTT